MNLIYGGIQSLQIDLRHSCEVIRILHMKTFQGILELDVEKCDHEYLLILSERKTRYNINCVQCWLNWYQECPNAVQLFVIVASEMPHKTVLLCS